MNTKPGIKLVLMPALFCGALLGCNDSERTWSQDLKSPDENHIAIGRADIVSGFGTDAAQITVDINWTHGSQKPVNVLTLPDANSRGEPSLVTMRWLDSTHLELEYHGKEEPLFQAVKCDGVNITLKQD